jgi:hypothetical protein
LHRVCPERQEEVAGVPAGVAGVSGPKVTGPAGCAEIQPVEIRKLPRIMQRMNTVTDGDTRFIDQSLIRAWLMVVLVRISYTGFFPLQNPAITKVLRRPPIVIPVFGENFMQYDSNSGGVWPVIPKSALPDHPSTRSRSCGKFQHFHDVL